MTIGTENATPALRGTQREPVVRSLRPSTFYVIVALIFVCDQFSKAWVRRMLGWGETRPLIGNAFGLTLTQNTGGAWGLLPQGNLLFVVFAAVAVIALLFAYHRMQRIELLVGGAFALALGGALGNLLDRLRFGYVVDFFDARIIHWPIFNIADSAISLGIVLLLLHFVQAHKTEAAIGERSLPSTASLAAEEAGSGPKEN
ncbi:MAG TPA: signal peptidase II [Chthonomonadaceae bacterium]|nr:signal peptidase II [Chthonomonadaceae bacterium]